MDANRDEASRCVAFARRCLASGDLPKARKLTIKAQRLYPDIDIHGILQFLLMYQLQNYNHFSITLAPLQENAILRLGIEGPNRLLNRKSFAKTIHSTLLKSLKQMLLEKSLHVKIITNFWRLIRIHQRKKLNVHTKCLYLF